MHSLTPILFALTTFCSTFLGGLFALKFKNKIHSIMAFTAGVLLGVVSFDIFPEIIEQIKINNFASTGIMISLVFGFLLFHVLEKTVLIHHAHESDYAHHHHPQVGVISALALAGHSLMDGVSIGLGFQISPVVGVLMAVAVISHDFTDGMNTVTMMLRHHNGQKKAKLFLFIDAIAPIIGATSTLFFKVSPQFLVLYLGFFAGFLLYIGASDILPEAHSQESSFEKIGLTIAGTLFIFFISYFI
ncbi:MAG: ZIP family metal transporter [Candidatus Falkowbacteria bacterium]